jgi:DNA-binding NarL/FixJ family response regulator
MAKTKVFITDDHSMFRKGVISILEKKANIEVIGEADTPESMVGSASLVNANLLLLDLSLGEKSGLEYISSVRKKNPKIKIIILSMHNKPILIKKAVNLGADGYVVKQSPPEILIQAIKTVEDGYRYLDPALSDSIYLCLSEAGSVHTESDVSYNSLSKREQEVFRLLAEGFTAVQISKKLYISRKTVENHRSNLMSKLKLQSLPDLISYANDLGVI